MLIHVTEKEGSILISPIYIQSKYGTLQRSELSIERKEINLESVLTWRSKPNKLHCNFSYIKSISKYKDDLDVLAKRKSEVGTTQKGVSLSPIRNEKEKNPADMIYSSGLGIDAELGRTIAALSTSATNTNQIANPMLYDDVNNQMKLSFHFSDFKLIVDFSATKEYTIATDNDDDEDTPSKIEKILAEDDENENGQGPEDGTEKISNELDKLAIDESKGFTTPVKSSNRDQLLDMELVDSPSSEDSNGNGLSPPIYIQKSQSAEYVNKKVYTIDKLYDLLVELHQKSIKIHQIESMASHNNASSTSSNAVGTNTVGSETGSAGGASGASLTPAQMQVEINLKEEQLIQLNHHLRQKEAIISMNYHLNRFLNKTISAAYYHWIARVKTEHEDDMIADRHRWRLHATSNQELDLQAWYHSFFYQEVYRLRGHFWFKDAVLPSYRQSYDLVDNGLTPLEEAALAHVLCSPDTTYGDVAGQMFIVQAILTPKLFVLFQQLASQGAQVIKYPRQGRPAKKLFRFSFVEGNIYLTWKGKFGNQGVGMSEVTGLAKGITTDILKWSAHVSKADQYLSVLCEDRSVDLLFESEDERNQWYDVLTALIAKERNTLPGVESILPDTDVATHFDYAVLYSSIGKEMNLTNKSSSTSDHDGTEHK